MRVRLEAPGGIFGTRVINAETGAEIEGVRAVSFSHRAGELPTLEIEILPGSLSAEMGVVTSLALCNPVTGETKQVKRIEFMDGSELDLSRGH